MVEYGSGVKSLEPGDHVIPRYIPECGECEYCRSTKSNLCRSIAATVWTGYIVHLLRRELNYEVLSITERSMIDIPTEKTTGGDNQSTPAWKSVMSCTSPQRYTAPLLQCDHDLLIKPTEKYLLLNLSRT